MKNCDLVSSCETNLSPTSFDVNLDELDSKLEWLSPKPKHNQTITSKDSRKTIIAKLIESTDTYKTYRTVQEGQWNIKMG